MAAPSSAHVNRTGAPDPTGWRGVLPLWAVVVPWLVSRAVAGAGLVWGGVLNPNGGPFFGWAMWDAGWYACIAHDGYGSACGSTVGETNWPFFPLFPWMMDLGHTLGAEYLFTGAFVSHLAFLAALGGLWRLARRHFGPRVAAIAVWCCALFPATPVMSMAYPSALYLAATVWGYCLFDERRDVAAGLCLAAATLTRPNGVVAVLALAVALWPRAGRPAEWRRALVVAGVPLVALVSWLAWLWAAAGDPFVFWRDKALWNEVTVVEFLGAAGTERAAWPHLAMAVPALAVLAWQARRLPRHWVAFAALYLLPSMVLGVVGLGRYVNDCFVAFMAAGVVLERVPALARRTLYVLAGGGAVVFALLVTNWSYVP